jgi:hypothetical protein
MRSSRIQPLTAIATRAVTPIVFAAVAPVAVAGFAGGFVPV